MWIVAVAWIYVVALMAATEPSIVHGLMTFLCYCVLPLSIVFYLTGSKRRRARREAKAQADAATKAAGASSAVGAPVVLDGSSCGGDAGGCDGGAGGS